MTSYMPDPWVPIWTCDVSTSSPTATGYAAQAATEIVWSLSGRQFGLTTITLRPCRRRCFDPQWWGSFGGTWYGGYYGPSGGWGWPVPGPWGIWFDPSCNSCLGQCSCTELSEIVLPSPVNQIVTVKMDGTPMVTGAYRLDNDRFLVRTDGSKWPYCNDLTKDDTAAGTWSVTAKYGQDVPVGGQLAVGELACEILKAVNGDASCKLPAGLQSVTRQGVQFSFSDLGQLWKDGITGFDLVDRWVMAVNPHKLAARSRVYSVDSIVHRRTGR